MSLGDAVKKIFISTGLFVGFLFPLVCVSMKVVALGGFYMYMCIYSYQLCHSYMHVYVYKRSLEGILLAAGLLCQVTCTL